MTTKKRRIVFDTNASLSAIILPDSVSGRAWRLGLEHFEPITSESAMEEFERESHMPSLQKYIGTNDERENAVIAINQMMLHIDVESIVNDSIDADDNKFLELALDGRATILVSGDPDFTSLHPWRCISILGTGDFVRAFELGILDT